MSTLGFMPTSGLVYLAIKNKLFMPKVGSLQYLSLQRKVSLSEAPSRIDEMQRRLKSAFVAQSLMLGEFHPSNETPGLHNPKFKPLQTPVPALAIRYMVDSDLPFLNDDKYSPLERATLLKAFLKQDFNKNAEAAKQALAEAEAELKSR